jgi:hypothetical protein
VTVPRGAGRQTARIVPYERFVELRDRRRRTPVEVTRPASVAPEPLPTIDCVDGDVLIESGCGTSGDAESGQPRFWIRLLTGERDAR